MALETTTLISGLVPTNPTDADQEGQGSSHIRMIKGALKGTFPNIAAAVTASDTQLNAMVGLSVSGTAALVGTVPISFVGEIKMIASGYAIPTGWHVCDGTNGTPNLVDRFIVGAGSSYGSGATGGASSIILSGSQLPAHGHGVTDTGHAHGLYDPGHAHTLYDPGHSHGVTDPTHSHNTTDSYIGIHAGGGVQAQGGTGAFGQAVTESTMSSSYTGISINAAATGMGINAAATGMAVYAAGTGVSIQSAGGSAPVDIRPPFYALYFIMRIA